MFSPVIGPATAEAVAAAAAAVAVAAAAVAAAAVVAAAAAVAAAVYRLTQLCLYLACTPKKYTSKMVLCCSIAQLGTTPPYCMQELLQTVEGNCLGSDSAHTLQQQQQQQNHQQASSCAGEFEHAVSHVTADAAHDSPPQPFVHVATAGSYVFCCLCQPNIPSQRANAMLGTVPVMFIDNAFIELGHLHWCCSSVEFQSVSGGSGWCDGAGGFWSVCRLGLERCSANWWQFCRQTVQEHIQCMYCICHLSRTVRPNTAAVLGIAESANLDLMQLVPKLSWQLWRVEVLLAVNAAACQVLEVHGSMMLQPTGPAVTWGLATVCCLQLCQQQHQQQQQGEEQHLLACRSTTQQYVIHCL
jgi:hypothetical protein